ncbi:MAG: hypothetical protein AB1452_05285 [Pseudomonadota bacterium]
MLLRVAPARIVASSARRTLLCVPGVRAVEGLRLETVAGRMPRLTAWVRVAPSCDPAEACRNAAIAIFERLPPVELRILIAEEPPDEAGRVLPFAPV